MPTKNQLLADRDLLMNFGQAIARVEQKTDDLVAQVTKQNGNVAKLWAEVGALKEHTHGRLAAIEQGAFTAAASAVAVRDATAPWLKWAERAGVFILGVMFILALKHGDEVLKAINVFKVG